MEPVYRITCEDGEPGTIKIYAGDELLGLVTSLHIHVSPDDQSVHADIIQIDGIDLHSKSYIGLDLVVPAENMTVTKAKFRTNKETEEI